MIQASYGMKQRWGNTTDFNNYFGTCLKVDNHFVIVTWLFALVIQTIAREKKTPTKQGK